MIGFADLPPGMIGFEDLSAVVGDGGVGQCVLASRSGESGGRLGRSEARNGSSPQINVIGRAIQGSCAPSAVFPPLGEEDIVRFPFSYPNF